jgi:nitroimidazol reductase NimA-like FMN-containing flavoprotein (pyridoxamine 5'-phosphate oxidase superfamily)
MQIQDMTRAMIFDLLKTTRIGRIACAQDAQPYITPFSFAYADGALYAFATPGMKVEWMRANPLVCVEAEDIVSREEWRTIVIFGRYTELTDAPDFDAARGYAHDLLSAIPSWWEPGYARMVRAGTERPVYFRISIDDVSGRQGVPDRIGRSIDRPA